MGCTTGGTTAALAAAADAAVAAAAAAAAELLHTHKHGEQCMKYFNEIKKKKTVTPSHHFYPNDN